MSEEESERSSDRLSERGRWEGGRKRDTEEGSARIRRRKRS